MAKNFWNSFSETLNLQPAANVLAAKLIKQQDAEDEAKAKFYADRQKQLDDARKLKDKIEGLSQYYKGGTEKTSFVSNLSPNIESKLDPKTGQIAINPAKITKPLVKAKTNFIKFTPEQQIEAGLKGGVSIQSILKDLQPKKTEYSKRIEKPYESLGLNKATNQWESLGKYDKSKGETNPAYQYKYRDAEINLMPKVTWNKQTGQGFYTTDIGLYDPEADSWKTGEDGKPLVLKSVDTKITAKATNGEDVLNKTLLTKFNEYSATQRELMAQLDVAHSNPTGFIVDPGTGKPRMEPKKDENGRVILNRYTGQPEMTPITEESLKSSLTAVNNQYISFTKNLASQNFLDWTDSVGEIASDKEYIEKLHDAYAKGWTDPKTKQKRKLDEYDLQIGEQFFQAAFGKDPLTFYNNE